jgi:TetR/AcrR family transcriptional repressor of nem operon
MTTKDYILGVSLKLFLQKNFKEVTMKEIVNKTGLSKGAFYHYFESKEKLFYEVINNFFASVLNVDFNEYSKESLYQFYKDCTKKFDTLKIDFNGGKKDSGNATGIEGAGDERDASDTDDAGGTGDARGTIDTEDNFFNMNFFFLIFDALKMFPEFRKKMEDYHKRELNAWTNIIKHAKKTGEIKTSMSDKHIAMVFIHTADGISMDLVLGGSVENLKNEIKSLWDKFYESLKA